METLHWIVSIVILVLLVYSFITPYLKGLDYTRLKQPDFSIKEEEVVVEEVLEKPAPKKKRPYRKRKPKNATTEKKDL